MSGPRGKIAVATLALADVPPALWPRLEAVLSEAEMARAARFHFERNRREHVAAHALKRLMLSDIAGGTPRHWEFTAEARGKPVVAGASGPHFNLSHCEGLVTCAVSTDAAVGIDVEAVGRRAPLEIVDDYFTDTERAWLLAIPESRRSLSFYRLWTMKEAILKASGLGLAGDLKSFSIAFDPLRIAFADPAGNSTARWQLLQAEIGDGHILGLAWCGPRADVSISSARFDATGSAELRLVPSDR